MGGAPDVGDGGQPATSGGAVYVSSHQYTGIYDSLVHSCTHLSLYWREGGYCQLNPKISMYYMVTEVGYEKKIMCIALEPWHNAFQCMPLMFEVSLS